MFTLNDGSAIAMPRSLAEYFYNSYIRWTKSSGKIHRSTINDYSMDAFDAVEVEMVNDTIVDGVEDKMSEKLSPIAQIFREISLGAHEEFITFDDVVTVQELLMFVNSVYSFISSEIVGDFKVGEAQLEESSLFDPNNIHFEDVVRYYAMILIEELVELWE